MKNSRCRGRLAPDRLGLGRYRDVQGEEEEDSVIHIFPEKHLAAAVKNLRAVNGPFTEYLR